MLLTLHTCNAILHLSAPSESSLEPSIEEGLATHFKSSSHSPLKLPPSPPLTQGKTDRDTLERLMAQRRTLEVECW